MKVVNILSRRNGRQCLHNLHFGYWRETRALAAILRVFSLIFCSICAIVPALSLLYIELSLALSRLFSVPHFTSRTQPFTSSLYCHPPFVNLFFYFTPKPSTLFPNFFFSLSLFDIFLSMSFHLSFYLP